MSRDKLGEAQDASGFEIGARGLEDHPALLGDVQPALGLSRRSRESAEVLSGREIIGPTKDSVVDFYLALLDTQLSESRNQTDEARRQLAAVTWSCLRQATIIQVPGELYGSFYHLADRYTTERVGATWHEQNAPAVKQTMTSRQFYQAVVELGTYEPLPKQRPFEYIYLGYKPKIRVNQSLASLYGLHDAMESKALKQFALGGHLIGPDSVLACLMLELQMRDAETDWKTADVGGTSMVMERHSGKWRTPYTLAPWVIPSLIEWINEHKTVIVDSRTVGYRLHVKRAFKKNKLKKLVPPPYYTVRMQNATIKSTAKAAFATCFKQLYEYNHRWTVRGHWVVRVKRGALPLSAKVEASLRKRKYKIFTDSQPDWDTWKHLLRRGVKPKQVDEWMAVLVSWRRDYIKGPEDAPLIPSKRESGKKRRLDGQAAASQGVFSNQGQSAQ